MVLLESENIVYGGDDLVTTQQQRQSHQLHQQAAELNLDMNHQNSILSLTLNEIQLKRGKSVGSMNMDEFLANLWSGDEGQVLPHINLNESTQNFSTVVNQTPLRRQGSFSIPTPLCKKTVDEVWYEIQREQPYDQKPVTVGAHRHPLDGQPTLGEITLEDFLIKAGVVHEVTSQEKALSSGQNENSCIEVNFGVGLGGFSITTTHHQNVGTNMLAAGNGFSSYQMFPQGQGYGGEAAPSNGKDEKGEGLVELGAQQIKKKIVDGPPEVLVERRQRRMIKNRESAARSRARKQAYTVELELELNQLREENAKLKQIVVQIEQKRKEEVAKRKQSTTLPQQKADKGKTLRRTTSLAW
ncbi:hypothetical protein K2173_014183 [Erythroxylum novogranatense]|uniref:BZIP domain-containing protein n=1 Tax=Erythroxylum novogranatense TaxID=1862640 RepID=A0AAV8SDN8_9ROSI|nr:hypothetical protein K2173_014183 [Erythroxylum novogranatense]